MTSRNTANGPRRNKHEGPGMMPGPSWVSVRLMRDQACGASAKLRVTAGSTGMPGPVVVETVTFLM
ncbi:Uncharacterised protein [Clostridioides difficile]|nr:Uncharacterised protein [Clostridioides difficile]